MTQTLAERIRSYLWNKGVYATDDIVDGLSESISNWGDQIFQITRAVPTHGPHQDEKYLEWSKEILEHEAWAYFRKNGLVPVKQLEIQELPYPPEGYKEDAGALGFYWARDYKFLVIEGIARTL